MEFLPKKPDDDLDLDDKYPGLNSMLSEYAQASRAISPRKKNDRLMFAKAVSESFELVGGVPRLAMWADANYGDFMKLFAKLAPPAAMLAIQASGPVKIVSAIPPSPLDGEWEEGELVEQKKDGEV